MGDRSQSDDVANVTIGGETTVFTEPKGGSESDAEVRHVFNEQTNYVPRRTIITVNIAEAETPP